ncbi:ATP-dependent Clp protease ATP-binding subunit ClpX [Sphingomonas sp. 3-13AW]|uniref:ATP-dependent Clp protease ATP-binding subunit ClpX n=1 Tax=Sphingomonas sp. 3-13AW TaxID=3050450 RepID=UPI003BB5A5B9
MSNDANKTNCSFCGRNNTQVKRIFSEGSAAICNECVDGCVEHSAELDAQSAGAAAATATRLEGEDAMNAALDAIAELASPRAINEHLNDYVIGQEKAKRVMSVAVYNHYKRLAHDQVLDDIGLQKSNMVIVGPTGSGKTQIARALAKKIDVPFAVVDATSLTASGYVGDDVETILSRLIEAADGDVARAQRGIIFIDEIDKIALKGENMSVTRDVSGEDVQNALLKIMEGTLASVPVKGGGRKHPDAATYMVDTSGILFIGSGAFVGLEKIVERRLEETSIGFGARVGTGEERRSGDLMKHVTVADLMAFGMKPELLGRMPVLTTLDALDVDTLVRIMTEPKDALVAQFHRMFDIESVELVFTDAALRRIAEESIKAQTGARGLRSLVENILLDDMYDLPELEGVAQIIVDINEQNVVGTRRVDHEARLAA